MDGTNLDYQNDHGSKRHALQLLIYSRRLYYPLLIETSIWKIGLVIFFFQTIIEGLPWGTTAK